MYSISIFLIQRIGQLIQQEFLPTSKLRGRRTTGVVAFIRGWPLTAVIEYPHCIHSATRVLPKRRGSGIACGRRKCFEQLFFRLLH
jgi:hypothetical protein